MAETIQRGKIKKAPAAEIVQYLIRPAIEADLKRSYNTILDINKAHILMLAKTGIIRKEVAKQLLQATAQIESEKDHPTFDINPNVEDLYFNLERYLIKLTGLVKWAASNTRLAPATTCSRRRFASIRASLT